MTGSKDNGKGLLVTRDMLRAFDLRMGFPGLGQKYVNAGVFKLREDVVKEMSQIRKPEEVPA